MAEISIAAEPANSTTVRWCFEQYADELRRTFGDHWLEKDLSEA